MLQRLSLVLFLLSSLLPWTLAVPGVKTLDGDSIVSKTTDYPLPNQGNIPMHDPSIVEYGGYFYIFRGGIHLPIFKSSSLDGPWTKIGTVFDGPSVIEKENRTRPWAPTTVQHNGMFYCFYTLSCPGVRNSAIGVATTDRIDTDGGGSWTDHGALLNTERGPLSHVYPYSVSNAIDASFITDQKTGQAYLLYGSYWQGIFQLPLSDDLLSIANKKRPNAAHLASLPDEKPKAIEGSFMSYHKPYYYLWYSRGKCCGFEHGFPKKGKEYEIRVGRSTHIRGPFLDKTGRQLLDGGGTVVYGSNHEDVYAPGGLGVLPESDEHQDILYYHYMNTTIGFLDPDSRLGYSYLEYVDGWPEARATCTNRSPAINAKYAMNLLVLMCMCYLILNVFRQRFSGPRLILVPAGFLVIWVLVWIY